MKFKSTAGMSPKESPHRVHKISPFQMQLSLEHYAKLNGLFPPSNRSGDIGKRAVEIAKIYLERLDPSCKFVNPPKGADLAVVSSSGELKIFEIKGTVAPDIAWPQLKVSSEACYQLLTSGSAIVLRISHIYAQEPLVYELHYWQDFRLHPEPRWAFEPVSY